MKSLVHLLTKIHCDEDIIPHLVENHYEKVKVLNDYDKRQNDDAQYSMKPSLNINDIVVVRSKESSEETFRTVPNPSWNKELAVNIVVKNSDQNDMEVKLNLDNSKKESELYATRFTADEEICGNQ